MKKKHIFYFLFSCAVVISFLPFNRIYYIRDSSRHVKLSRIERRSLLFSYGTFFTPGVYSSFIFKPSSYVNPKYVSAHPFDSGCFEIIAEFAGDTTIIYMGTPCVSKNLNEKFQLIDLPNAFGEKNWISIKDDRSGKYLNLDCNLSEM